MAEDEEQREREFRDEVRSERRYVWGEGPEVPVRISLRLEEDEPSTGHEGKGAQTGG